MSSTKEWKIDSAHSGINFSVRHMVVSKVRGRFAKYEGVLDIDEANPTQSTVEVTIDAASLDTGVPDRDAHLRSADFFDVAKYPTLHFRSQRIEKADDSNYRLVGALTIRDVTREVTLAVEYSGRATDPYKNERGFFVASASINRIDFGLKWNQLLEAGGVLVGERIDIEIELQAVKAQAAKVAA